MMDDRELALIAAFRLHEVAGRLSVLSRVARSQELRQLLHTLSAELSEHERGLSTIAKTLPSDSQGHDGETAASDRP